LTQEGEVVTVLGRGGAGEGEFDRPEGIVIDHAGYVFVVDSRNSRIQKFAPLH
jgi:tripartite motif-containing protein 71